MITWEFWHRPFFGWAGGEKYFSRQSALYLSVIQNFISFSLTWRHVLNWHPTNTGTPPSHTAEQNGSKPSTSQLLILRFCVGDFVTGAWRGASFNRSRNECHIHEFSESSPSNNKTMARRKSCNMVQSRRKRGMPPSNVYMKPYVKIIF